MRYGYAPPEEEDEFSSLEDMMGPDEEGRPYYLDDPGAAEEPATAPPPAPQQFAPPAPSPRPPPRGAEALSRAHDRDNLASISQETINGITNAFTGRPVQGKDRSTDFARQRTEMRQQHDDDSKAAALAEMNDPASGKSRATRDILKAAMPDIASQMGPHFERLSHAAAKDLFPFLGQYMRTLEKRSAAPARYELKPETQEEIAAARIEQMRRGPAPRVPREPRVVNPLDEEEQRLRIEKRKRDLAEAGKKSGTDGAEDPLLHIDGHILDPKFRVKPEVAERLRKSQAESETLQGQINEVLELYKTYGNATLPGTARARMSALITHAQLAAKGESQFGLGVLAGPDMDILNSAVPNVTGKEATVSDFFGGESPERLQVMLEQAQAKMGHALHSRGYRPDPGGERQTTTKKIYGRPGESGSFNAGSPVTPRPGMVRIQDKATGKRGWAKPGAIPEGAEEVTDGR